MLELCRVFPDCLAGRDYGFCLFKNFQDVKRIYLRVSFIQWLVWVMKHPLDGVSPSHYNLISMIEESGFRAVGQFPFDDAAQREQPKQTTRKPWA